MIRNVSKNRLFSFLCVLMLSFSFSGVLNYSLSAVNVYASTIEDDLSGDVENNQSANPAGSLSGGSITEDDKAVSNWIKSQRGMTGEQLETASRTLSPLTTIIGYLVGAGVALIFSLVTFVTVLDLIYISIPFVRKYLYASGTDGTGAAVGGMGGYPGAMGGGGAQRTQWVSDEAVQCAAMLGGSAGTAGRGAGMGMGMNYGQTQGVQEQQSKKSVIGMYFKKRIGFIILLVICVMVLTSSILMGTGANLAEWGLRMIDMLNGYIPK